MKSEITIFGGHLTFIKDTTTYNVTDTTTYNVTDTTTYNVTETTTYNVTDTTTYNVTDTTTYNVTDTTFHRHSRWLYSQQQSSSFSSNRFIEHDVSTRKLGPSSGIRPSFLNRSIYTFLVALSRCCYASPEIVLKKC